MGITFAGQACLDLVELRQQCLDRGLSLEWFGLPNSFACPLGTAPGEGWVMLSGTALAAIDPGLTFGGLYDLTFRTDLVEGPGPQSVTLRNLVVLGADCVTPGASSQDEAAYLVRLADRRHLSGRTSVDAAYNERHVLTAAYLPATTNGGIAWSWDQVLADLWAQVGKLGAYPGLPFSPDGLPEDLEFWQVPGLQAIGDVLGRLGCELRYDPLADAFGIVRPGAADPSADAALARWDRWRHWDATPVLSVRGSIPSVARVLFRKLPHVRGTSSPFLAIDQPDPTPQAAATGVEPGTCALVHDDLEALYDAHDRLTNLPALQSRAAERAADFFRRLWSVTNRSRRLYPLALADPGLLPGAQVRSIRWADTAGALLPGRGMTTEVVRVGDVPRPRFPDVQIDPLTEVVRLTGATSPDGLLDAYRQNWDPAAQQWVDRQQIWVKDANA